MSSIGDDSQYMQIDAIRAIFTEILCNINL